MLEMDRELLKDALDIVNKQKDLIAKIEDKQETERYIDMISELQKMIDDLEQIYGDYVYSMSGYTDYHYVDVNIYHISSDGLSNAVVKHIVNKDLKNCDLFWIEPYNEGLTFKFHI
jgi:hypothetical protein